MYENTSPFDLTSAAGSASDVGETQSSLQPVRVRGGVTIGLVAGGTVSGSSRTVARERREYDGYKIRTPNRPDVCEVAIVNTGGGIASGDDVRIAVTAEPGTDAVITSPAAERVYAALGERPASYSVDLTIGAGARVDWLPQETILFDRARLNRRFTIDMASDATLLLSEVLVFGRTAHGEVLSSGQFKDQWIVRRAGRIAHAEMVTLEGDLTNVLAGPATAQEATAMATIVLIAPNDLEHQLANVRDVLAAQPNTFTAGASAWHNKLIVRMLGHTSQAVRQALDALVPALGRRSCPRVWNC